MGLQAMELYEQLWNVSYEFLNKNCNIACAITGIMQKRAGYLHSQVLKNSRNKDFAADFKKAHDELQNMSKSVQTFVNEWQALFIEETSICAENSLPPDDFEFNYIKPTLLYKKNHVVKLLISDVSKTRQGVFCAVDQCKFESLNCLKKLQTVSKSPLHELPPAGEVFAILLEDTWFRAVRNSSSGGEEEKKIDAICLLDTGEVYPYQNTFKIAKLSEDFQNHPAYFIQCRMEAGSSATTLRQWDKIYCKVVDIEDDLLVLENLGEVNGKLVHNTQQSDEKISASNTTEGQSTADQSNSEHLDENNSSLSVNDPIDQSKEETFSGNQYAITRDTLSKEQVEQFDELPEGTTNAMKAVLGYDPKDDWQICKYYDPIKKRCFKGANCRRRHIEMDPDGWTRDRDTVSVSGVQKMEVPAQDSYVTLLPTSVTDLDMFFCHIVPPEGYHLEFNQLADDLNNPQVVANYKPLNLLPTIGELVLAKYENLWYRAQVIELFDNSVTVFYVDYGNVETVSLDEIKACDERFKFLPFQAIFCRLANACHVDSFHTPAIEQFTMFVLDKPLKAYVVGNGTPLDVKLYDEDGYDVGELMIMTNLAMCRTPSKFGDDKPIPG
ncbi:uncharacterized protein LOC131260136 [Anopheles coustani]|uniref:uncharacterized protein LOC131260136 n=1 Tax=Anopheles coustani TaxID=139045 RepID=UPI00265B0244|nr:uncharacterized protein LOC131260136 [Anopheles coustani]XP_058117791.1 uncharacterized protein LOC131260136 [Anopheles coustani]